MKLCGKCEYRQASGYVVPSGADLCEICRDDYEEETWCDGCDNWLCDCECGDEDA